MKATAQLIRSIILTGVAVATLLPLGCSRAPRPGVLATVGERQITTEDLRLEIERRRKAHRPVPDKETLLQELVTFAALVQRAQAAQLADDPQVRHELNALLVTRLQEQELRPQLDQITVTSEEIKAEYEREIAKYTRPEKVRLAILTLKLDPKASDAQRTEARERLSAARAQLVARQDATDFGTLAIDYSEDQASRYRGGDIGWMDAGDPVSRWPQAVLAAGCAQTKGGVTEVIEQPEGVYLVMKTDSRPGFVQPLAEVDGALRHVLTVRKRQQAEQAFRAAAIAAARATVNTQALAAVQLQFPELAAARPEQSTPPGVPTAGTPSPH